MGCSPCGILAVPVSGRAMGLRVADPEVLLSLLPVTTLNYSKNSEFQDTEFQDTISDMYGRLTYNEE